MRCTRLQNTRCRAAVGVLLWIVAAGCWQEVEYAGPQSDSNVATADASTDQPGSAAEHAASQPPLPLDSEAAESGAQPTDFDDNLPADLASQTSAANDHEAATAPPGDDRYPLEVPDITTLLPHELPAPAPEAEAPVADAIETTQHAPPPVEETIAQTDETPPADASTSTSEPIEPQIYSDPSATQPPASLNARLAAWQLGSKLSLAALANDRGVTSDKVDAWLTDSRQLAAALNTAIVDLPPTGAADQSGRPSRDVLSYLFQQSAEVSRQLRQDHDAVHAALYEVAVKSNLLLVLYQPRSSAAEAIAAAIQDAAPRAELPQELVQPLLDAISTGEEAAGVRRHVQRFHAEVEQHLAQSTEQ